MQQFNKILNKKWSRVHVNLNQVWKTTIVNQYSGCCAKITGLYITTTFWYNLKKRSKTLFSFCKSHTRIFFIFLKPKKPFYILNISYTEKNYELLTMMWQYALKSEVSIFYLSISMRALREFYARDRFYGPAVESSGLLFVRSAFCP